jgi:ubiquinone/menaquinone biosynthesis C-methylase UbiE
MSEARFAELKARQSKMWGSGPYERISEQLRPAHDHLLRRLQPKGGVRWLDVATGTGELAVPAASAGAEVTGLDLAPILIETASQRAARSGVQVRFEVGDAEDMPYLDANFDVVSSTFGVMFAPDHEAVARELARVCRSGGRIGLATWRPDSGVGDLFKVMAPFQAPTPEGVGNPFDWGREEHAERLLGEAFDLTFEDGDVPQTGASGEELWELFSTAYGPTKALASSLEPERREQLHRAWVDYYEKHRVNGSIRQPRQYLLILGMRR